MKSENKPPIRPTSRRTFPRYRGFTLTELLVVIIIIAVLAAIGFPITLKMRNAAGVAACASNLKQVGVAIIEYAVDNNNKLPGLQPIDPATGERGNKIWTEGLANAGYLWNTPGKGTLPCGTGVWTCPDCDFMSNTYGGYGVVEDSIFRYDENGGSLRLNQIDDPANTWLVGDASRNASAEPNKGWYTIWSQPDRWSSHGPAARHSGKSNVCMVDGHVESLRTKEIQERELTENVVRP